MRARVKGFPMLAIGIWTFYGCLPKSLDSASRAGLQSTTGPPPAPLVTALWAQGVTAMGKRVWVIAAVVAALATGVQAAEPGPYPWRTLRDPGPRAQVEVLFAAANVREPWVLKYWRDGEGTENPLQFVTIGGQKFLYAEICRPHHCMEDELHLLILPGAVGAVGALIRGGRVEVLGNPAPAVRQYLLELAP